MALELVQSFRPGSTQKMENNSESKFNGSQVRILPYKQFVGFMVPNRLARSKTLTAMEKLIWGRLAQYAGKDGNCFPSYQTLADELGCRRQAIVFALKSLEEKGFIIREPVKGRSTNFYFLDHPELREPGTVSVPPSGTLPGTETVPPPGTETVPPPGTETVPRRESVKRIKETTSAAPRADVERSDADVLLELTPEQTEFIRLSVAHKKLTGTIRNPTAFRHSLEAMARAGNLDISDLAWLREQVEPVRAKPVKLDVSDCLSPAESAKRARALREMLNGRSGNV